MEDDKEVLRFTWSDEKRMWWMGPVKGISSLKESGRHSAERFLLFRHPRRNLRTASPEPALALIIA
jgi:hypothetical protein